MLTNIFTYKDRQIPTVISYVDGDEYYGGQAKAFLVRNPDNTISSFRDFLGQEYATPNFTLDRSLESTKLTRSAQVRVYRPYPLPRLCPP